MLEKRSIGAELLNAGLIDQAALERALEIQKNHGGKIGQILSSLGLLKPLALYKTLAIQQSIPLVNIQENPIDPSLITYEELEYYLAHGCIPWRIVNGDMVIACIDLTPKVRHWSEQFYHNNVCFILVTPRDFLNAIKHHFGANIDHDTRHRLAELTPQYSAKTTFFPHQRQSMLIFAVSLLALCAIAPYSTTITLLFIVNIFYLCTIGLKALLCYYHEKPQSHFPEISEPHLPLYSLLIPMYREASSVPHIIDAIRALDYPYSKLDVKLVVEDDDEETINAIKQAEPESFFEIIRVPYSEPRTKPKACNYALTFARGDYVTIYDAEDRPEPSQLKKAVAAFAHFGPQTICLQARLNYYNHSENLLTKLFSIEYSSLFDFMLPGLERLNMPIPLGGTSNHIHLKRLRELGDWDPYNVTEDADLGIRLAMQGFKTHTLDSITMEEAPLGLNAWLKQRSRWIKGYMQTWLVYMRHPKALYKNLGYNGFWGFQLFIGGPCLSFLIAPFLWTVCALWLYSIIHLPAIPVWLLGMCLLSMLSSMLCHLWLAIAAVKHWQWKHMTTAIILFPFYWLLHSIASFKALWQLIFRPHFWEKTTHGLTQLREPEQN